jgi:hypothetical protein
MSDIEILCLVLFGWAGASTAFYFEARRELRAAKHVMLILVKDKDERERFFTGFEKVLGGKLDE